MRNWKRKLLACLTTGVISVPVYCFHTTYYQKAWTGFNYQYTFSNNEKWHTFIFPQLRFINRIHPLQTTFLESGIGYDVVSNKQAWLGYRWSLNQTPRSFYQENRLFQQLIWRLVRHTNEKLNSRTRVEEFNFSHQQHTALRIRERLSYETGFFKFYNGLPYLYDEIFFQVNKTNYTAQNLISENRLFIGFNFYQSSNAYWEIGYINQWQMRTPLNKSNQLNHVLSLIYNLS